MRGDMKERREISIDAASQINTLYLQAKGTLVDGLKYYIECGIKLKAVKDSMQHGEWIPWLKENKGVLGFGEKTAPRLIKAANISLTRHLEESEAQAHLRQIWAMLSVLRGISQRIGIGTLRGCISRWPGRPR